MSATLTPTTTAELVEAVKAQPRVLAVGAQTKPRLSEVDGPKLSTAKLTGIVEYEPSEFTFTALAGTPVREIAAKLQESGQYLPFDPMLCAAGATLGGAVASGLSGPRRFRYGGLRDFILGVRFVDGQGRLLRMGGKVVKNAAGFDLPKFMVGSLGRFGVLGDVSFKVFPHPPATRTLRFTADSAVDAVRLFSETGNSRFEFQALDIAPDTTAVLARLGAPGEALDALIAGALQRWPGEVLSDADAAVLWRGLSEFEWAHADGALVKVPLTPADVPKLDEALAGSSDIKRHVSAAGNVAFISTPDDANALDGVLKPLHLTGLVLRGHGPLWLGRRESPPIAAAVKQALDPNNRFPSLDD